MDTTTSYARAEQRPRVEDDTLVRGAGRFVADRPEPGQAYAQFVRSPHAFAQIRSIDIDAAMAMPGAHPRTKMPGDIRWHWAPDQKSRIMGSPPGVHPANTRMESVPTGSGGQRS